MALLTSSSPSSSPSSPARASSCSTRPALQRCCLPPISLFEHARLCGLPGSARWFAVAEEMRYSGSCHPEISEDSAQKLSAYGKSPRRALVQHVLAQRRQNVLKAFPRGHIRRLAAGRN